MRTFTFEEVLKILGFEESYKQHLRDEVNGQNADVKYDIEKTCWKAFWELYHGLSNMRFQEMLYSIKMGEGKYTLDSSLMKKAKQAAWLDVEDILNGKMQDNNQISEIRSKLKSLSEM